MLKLLRKMARYGKGGSFSTIQDTVPHMLRHKRIGLVAFLTVAVVMVGGLVITTAFMETEKAKWDGWRGTLVLPEGEVQIVIKEPRDLGLRDESKIGVYDLYYRAKSQGLGFLPAAALKQILLQHSPEVWGGGAVCLALDPLDPSVKRYENACLEEVPPNWTIPDGKGGRWIAEISRWMFLEKTPRVPLSPKNI